VWWCPGGLSALLPLHTAGRAGWCKIVTFLRRVADAIQVDQPDLSRRNPLRRRGDSLSVREDVQVALEVLHEAAEWTLTPVGWRAVDGAVARLAAAVADSDVRGIRRAVAELEYAGPRRGVSGRTPPDSEPGRVPGQLRERINELIHQIGDPPEDFSADDVGAGAAG
jgi:CATRA-associated small protein